MNSKLNTLFNQSKIVFWDFDGVIKDSVSVKSTAFETLFSNYGSLVSARVRNHHENNNGISRFEKIPLYLSWSDEVVTDAKIQDFCNRFSLLVKQAVINSPWVGGFLEFFECYRNRKIHILVTATPTKEIKEILQSLNIRHFFYSIYGAPNAKSASIGKTLKSLRIDPKHAIMIGDSYSDYEASVKNKITFVLRKTDLNKELQNKLDCLMIRDYK